MISTICMSSFDSAENETYITILFCNKDYNNNTIISNDLTARRQIHSSEKKKKEKNYNKTSLVKWNPVGSHNRIYNDLCRYNRLLIQLL